MSLFQRRMHAALDLDPDTMLAPNQLDADQDVVMTEVAMVE